MTKTEKVMFAFQELKSKGRTKENWQALVRLVDALPEADRGDYIRAAASLATRLRLVRPEDLNKAFAEALQ